MTLRLTINRLVLTSHVATSVGWYGSVVVFLALAITGLNSSNTQLVRAACLAMDISAWFVILPFCIVSLSTGVAQSLITKWGLFDYYWIVVKMFLTVFMTILLLLHLQPISNLAEAAVNTSFSKEQESRTMIDLISKSGSAVLGLLATITISVFKPWGKIENSKRETSNPKKPLSFYIFWAVLILVIIFVIVHLSGGKMGH